MACSSCSANAYSLSYLASPPRSLRTIKTDCKYTLPQLIEISKESNLTELEKAYLNSAIYMYNKQCYYEEKIDNIIEKYGLSVQETNSN